MAAKRNVSFLIGFVLVVIALGMILRKVAVNNNASLPTLTFFRQQNHEVEKLQNDVKDLKEKLRSQRSLLEELACASKGIGARGGFCLKADKINVGYNDIWDLKMCVKLEDDLFKDQVVGDFGAGLGWYGMYWTRKQKPSFRYGSELEIKHFYNKTNVMDLVTKTPMKLKSWQGFDGAGNVELVTNDLVSYLDLSEKQDLGIKFDWVFSLEVGEHIPQAFETVFIENLIRHSCKG
ncbi:hypothetical protein CHUAL_006382 [Chamberlinius hualienensis]